MDPDPPGCIDLDAWRGEKNGYRGHHNRCASEDPRIYSIELDVAGMPVFKALLRLNTALGMLLQDGFELKAGITFSAGRVVAPPKGLVFRLQSEQARDFRVLTTDSTYREKPQPSALGVQQAFLL
jgi:hypothetical protein